MLLTLRRDDLAIGHTLGSLFVDGRFQCFTLEDQVRDGPKIFGATAIPSGKYRIEITQSIRFKRPLPLLLNVPGFDGIRIHPGNTAEDTEGCILVGLNRGPGYISQSRLAFDALFKRLLDAKARAEPINIDVSVDAAVRAVA